MSVIKKIDSLGRVVLPKSIRKRVGLNENSQVELSFQNGKIVISKYDMIEEKEKEILEILKILSENISKEALIILTDSNSIYKAINIDLDNVLLSPKYIELLNQRVLFNENYMSTFNILESNEPIYIKLSYPIIIDSLLIGSIVVASKDKNYVLKNEDKILIEFSSKIIKNKFK